MVSNIFNELSVRIYTVIKTNSTSIYEIRYDDMRYLKYYGILWDFVDVVNINIVA